MNYPIVKFTKLPEKIGHKKGRKNMPFFSPPNCKWKIALLLLAAVIASGIGRYITGLVTGMNGLLVGFSIALFIIVGVWYIIDTHGDYLFIDKAYSLKQSEIKKYQNKTFPMKPH